MGLEMGHQRLSRSCLFLARLAYYKMLQVQLYMIGTIIGVLRSAGLGCGKMTLGSCKAYNVYPANMEYWRTNRVQRPRQNNPLDGGSG